MAYLPHWEKPRQRLGIWAIPLAALLSFLLTGCFRMGLPEHFSPLLSSGGSYSTGVQTANRLQRIARSRLTQPPRALILFDDINLAQSGETKYIGHQYVLGLIPLTNLYLQHSIESLLLEKTFETLQREGYRTYITTSTNLNHSAALLRPQIIMKPTIDNLSINAYDILFMRRIVINGVVETDFYNHALENSGLTPRRIITQIDETHLRRFGHAPSLAYYLERAVTGAIERALQQKKVRLRYRSTSISTERHSPASIVLLSSPRYTTPAPALLAKALISSYGFENLPPFSDRSVLRIIQRGLEQGLQELKLDVITASSPRSTTSSIPGTIWQLQSQVVRVALTSEEGGLDPKDVELVMDFQILSQDDPENAEEIFSARCRVSVPGLFEIDGYWVATLEKAASTLASDLFQTKDESTLCTIHER